MTRVSEIFRGWLGWCPNARIVPEKSASMAIKHTDISSSAGDPGISRRIKRGFHLMKGSGQIVVQDKSLLWFSVFAGLVMLFEYRASDAIGFFTGMNSFSVASQYPAMVSWTGLIFLVYLVCLFFFILLFIGLLLCISAKMRGEQMTVGRGLLKAVGHLRAASLWIVVLAAVFTIIRLMMGAASGNFSSMNMVYSIFILAGAVVVGAMTMFVVPVLVFDNKNLITAIRDSISMFGKTWGEIAGGLGIFPLIYIAIAFIGILLISLTYTMFPMVSIVASNSLFLLLNIFLLVAMLLGGIFLVCLHSMAKTGTIPDIFTKYYKEAEG
ncbi:MAG: DUF6159 family protein [Methanoregula sp.]|nr:DUF6159 family protein [Methanoregula sp.]MDD5024157.1 DUF6159 family protein [Methanoregula sp.]MDD5186939.1 DUF6159 family protein [Methanoregula sp.]